MQPVRWRLVLGLLAVGCTSWSEEQVEGLRHVSAVVTTGGEGAVRIPVDVLDGDTQILAVVQAESPQRSVFASLDTPAASPAWVADTQATTLATNAGFVSSVSVLGYPMLPDDLPLEPGRWWLTAGAVGTDLTFAEGALTVDLWFAQDDDDRAGALEVVLHLADGLEADPVLVSALEEASTQWESLYAGYDITLSLATEPWTGESPQIPGFDTPDAWRAISEGPVRRVHVVVVDAIAALPGAYGLAGGIPGAIGSTPASGVLLSASLARGADGQLSDEEVRLLSETLAHEVGHYLGLFHPVEIQWDRWDALADTPDCTSESDCVDALANNLMFPFPVCALVACIPQNALTDAQVGVAQRHPVLD